MGAQFNPYIMNLGFHKKLHMVCFSLEDMEQLIRSPHEKQIIEEIYKRGFSFKELEDDIKGSRVKTEEIINSFKIINDKEDLEIFLATFEFQGFCPESKICYYLKENSKPEGIQSLELLKQAIKENNIDDFSLLSKEGDLRNFQLKTYNEPTEPKKLLSFIKKKLLHYGNNLGDTNLLVVLRGGGIISEKIFFSEIHNGLLELGLKGDGHVLISYNQENKFSIIITAYPTLGRTQKPKKFYSEF